MRIRAIPSRNNTMIAAWLWSVSNQGGVFMREKYIPWPRVWRVLLGLVIDRLARLRAEHSRLEALRRLGIR
jgi:hypothetical protein